MKTSLALAVLVFVLSSVSSSTYADESLATCSKQKIRQMELAHKNVAQKSRSKKRSSPTSSRLKIEQIDEWLWKNCRSHAAEMRTIEQQYM